MSFFDKFKKMDPIKKEIYERAMKLAQETYEKEIAHNKLISTTLNYEIIKDLIKAAQLVGKVTIKLADNSEVTIIDTSMENAARLDLNAKENQLF